MLLVFLDTEFTRFCNPELISIGLAAANGEEFYAETPYTHSSCSQFTLEVVIPLLASTDQISPENLGEKISNWLNSIRNDESVVLCFDSDYDKVLFLKIFADNPPRFIIWRGIGYRHINGTMRADFYRKTALREHHALNDAKALRYSFKGWLRSVR
jgi:hypothetical protein